MSGGQLSGGGGQLSYLALGFATIDPSVITWGVNCRGVNCRGVNRRVTVLYTILVILVLYTILVILVLYYVQEF